MSFQFSLDTVLQVRGILEEQEERMLQKILQEIAQTREALAQIEAGIAESDAALCNGFFKPVIGHKIHAAYGEMQELKQNRQEHQEKIRNLEELRDRQLIVYAKARQNREVLADICEEKRKEYESDMAHVEQKVMDDVFISRRVRS
jgi:flagellar export protein FliJ